MIDAGANRYAKSNNGLTPLDITTKNNAALSAKILLEDKAGIDLMGYEESIALHLAAWKDSSNVAKVLSEAGMNVNSCYENIASALHIAALKNSLGVAKVLLSAGADVNLKWASGLTPLHLAAYSDAGGVASFLVRSGADINALSNGNTPLLVAVQNKSESVVKELIAARANLYPPT